jgi:hypothetical protein
MKFGKSRPYSEFCLLELIHTGYVDVASMVKKQTPIAVYIFLLSIT